MTDYNDYPLDDIAASMQKQIARGAVCYQKWTCANCGERVTGNTPDKVFTQGYHEDCGYTTDLTTRGCNFMFILSAGGRQMTQAILKDLS